MDMPPAIIGQWCMAIEHVVSGSDTFPYKRCEPEKRTDIIVQAWGYAAHNVSCTAQSVKQQSTGVWTVMFKCKSFDPVEWDDESEIRKTGYGFTMHWKHSNIRKSEPQRYRLLGPQ